MEPLWFSHSGVRWLGIVTCQANNIAVFTSKTNNMEVTETQSPTGYWKWAASDASRCHITEDLTWAVQNSTLLRKLSVISVISAAPPPFFTFALFGAKHSTRGTLPNLQGLCTRQRQNRKRYLSTPVTANCCSQGNDCHKSYGHSHKAQHWGASGRKESLHWGCQTTLDQLYAAVSFKCTYNGLITMCHLYTFNICTSTLHHLYLWYSVVWFFVLSHLHIHICTNHHHLQPLIVPTCWLWQMWLYHIADAERTEQNSTLQLECSNVFISVWDLFSIFTTISFYVICWTMAVWYALKVQTRLTGERWFPLRITGTQVFLF